MSFSSQVGALNQQEIERRAREAKMQNALEILANFPTSCTEAERMRGHFVRATAREGLGRKSGTEPRDDRDDGVAPGNINAGF